MKQLILGTVQLGMNYGINNKKGKPSKEEAFSILNEAYKNNIRILDTAAAYGDSEKIIGEFRKNNNKHFEIVTKLKKIDENKDILKYVKNSVEYSLENLCTTKIEYYLYHSFADLVNNKNTIYCLESLRKIGKVEKIGVSIYDVEELEYILLNLYNYIDFIQIPFNLFDLRWLKDDLLRRTKEAGIEIAARSIFLQGLFFADETTAEKIHSNAYGYLDKLKEFSNIKGVTVEQLAMGFVKNQKYIDYILIGCENKEQLLKNIENFNLEVSFSNEDMNFINENFSEIKSKIIDPRRW